MMQSAAFIALALFVWGSNAGTYDDPNTVNYDMPIVHLFEWKWTDIANECENFLAPNGFGGVQTSPPSENAKIEDSGNPRPWWERYQPVSYFLDSTRSGNRAEFIDMVQRCNNAGVRVYPDIVVNHMTGYNNNQYGTNGCSYNYGNGDYPCVPYSYLDFNDDCSSGIDYNDANSVRDCRLSGLIDLKQSSTYVRGKIQDYMNDLINIGVAGFRVDACKHMWPGDLDAIFKSLSDLNTNFFNAGTRPFIYQEVIDQGGEAVTSTEYIDTGRVTEFKWSLNIGEVFHGVNGQTLSYLSNFGEGWNFLKSGEALVFVDNHDNQRGHGAGGPNILTYKESKLYKMGVSYMLAWPYGVARVMSSYDWYEDWTGPPHDASYNTLSPVFLSDGSCDLEAAAWICEHRWRQIYNMAKFRNSVAGTAVDNWWDNGNNQIAFSRGNQGFIAFNRESYDMGETIYTGLPPATYCDVISGHASETPNCSGKTVTVDGSGNAYIEIASESSTEDGVLAIHV